MNKKNELSATVIIPAFNAESTMGKCLEALAGQKTKKEFEVIVVDDGSKDKTKKIAKEFKKIPVVLLEQNHAGPAKARNLGARKAKGTIIIFLDSDCIARENWLEEILKPFENKEIAGVQGIYESRQKEFIARFIQLEIEERYKKMKKLERIDHIGSYSAAYRRELFLESGGFDENFPTASGEDTEFSYSLSEKNYRLVLNTKAIVEHFHPKTFSHYMKIKFKRAYWRTLIYKKHLGKIASDSYTSQKMKVQVGLFYLGVLGLILSIFNLFFIWFALAFFVSIFITAIPFALFAAKKDLEAGIIAPFLVFLRTIAFGIGLALGTIRELLGK